MIRRPPRSTRTDTLFPYTTLFRSLDVLSCHTLRRAVDDQISRSEQGVERPYDLDASSAHRLGVFVRGAIQGEALLRCHSGPPIGADVRYAGELHIVLASDRFSHALADDAITVNSHAGLATCVHLFLLVFRASRTACASTKRGDTLL